MTDNYNLTSGEQQQTPEPQNPTNDVDEKKVTNNEQQQKRQSPNNNAFEEEEANSSGNSGDPNNDESDEEKNKKLNELKEKSVVVLTDKEIEEKQKKLKEILDENTELWNNGLGDEMVDALGRDDAELLRLYYTNAIATETQHMDKSHQEQRARQLQLIENGAIDEIEKKLTEEQKAKLQQLKDNINKAQELNKQIAESLQQNGVSGEELKEIADFTKNAEQTDATNKIHEKIPPQMYLAAITPVLAVAGGIIAPAVMLVVIMKMLPLFTKTYQSTTKKSKDTPPIIHKNPEPEKKPTILGESGVGAPDNDKPIALGESGVGAPDNDKPIALGESGVGAPNNNSTKLGESGTGMPKDNQTVKFGDSNKGGSSDNLKDNLKKIETPPQQPLTSHLENLRQRTRQHGNSPVLL